jgi:hypothetical protein
MVGMFRSTFKPENHDQDEDQAHDGNEVNP